MSINSVKISQIVLEGVLYDVNVSYKDGLGDLFPIEAPSNFTLFSEDQRTNLHKFIKQSVAQIPHSKALSSYCSIKIDDEGVFSQSNEKLADLAEDISALWKETKAGLISHFENSTTSILIPLEQQASLPDDASLQEDEAPAEPEIILAPCLNRAAIEAAQATGTSYLQRLPLFGRFFRRLPKELPIVDEPQVKEAIQKEKSNEGYYKEIINAVFEVVITNRKLTYKKFIESLEEVAKELRKNESENSIKKQTSHKLSAQMIEKLKEIDTKKAYSIGELRALNQVYQRCTELKDASAAFSETSFTQIIQARRP